MANSNAQEIGVAYLSVKPKMSDDFDSSIKGHGKSSGSGFGNAFAVAAGNIISNAVTGIAQGAADVFTNAFNNFAEFEQLKGGVEKIFDQANISGIMDDAQRAYKELNLSANEYLASINQVGAAFAQTMGDQKGYDTARKGMQAISDYASGTGRNIDELNEKFAMITRATSSYQSIADQFSGILPATSADFLAQAQAAGLLSTEYTKLTDVPIAEYQQAVSEMLARGVDGMGLMGNTLAESTETISGSLAMLQSSWTNFTTELFKEDGDIATRAQELTDSIVAVVENVAPRLLIFAENLFAALPTLIDKLTPYIQQFVAMAAEFIEQHQPEIEAAGEVLFDGIKEAVKWAASAAVEALGELLMELVETFPEWYPKVQDAGYELIFKIIEGLGEGGGKIGDKISGIIADGLSSIAPHFGDFLKAGGEIVDNIVQGITGGSNLLETVFNNLHIQLPHIPLPHFSVSGGAFPYGIGGQGSMPSFGVQWYGKGGFAEEATLTGYGERGLEMYWPGYSPYFDKYAKGIAEHMPNKGGVDIHDCTFNVRQESDIRKVANELNQLINRQTVGAYA